MSDLYSNDSGSKKKFLAPVLVMLLCMVSLSGAAFAYSATVDNTGDQIIIEGVTLELKNGGGIVTTPMYTFNDIGIDTHTTNGKAIKYNETVASARGFTTAAAQEVDQGPHYEQVCDAPENYTDDLSNFITGYYVEVFKNGTPVGYKEPLPALTTSNFGDYDDAAHGMYKYATDYTLNVVNGSTGNIKIQADLTGTINFTGVKDVYLVVKDGQTIVGVTNLAASMADVTAAISNDGAEHSYTVEAWIALSDYASPTDVPTLSASAFAVHFQTVAAA